MREFWLERDGVRLFAIEEGSGPVVVMLHGGMANHQAAWPLVAPLIDRYRVVVPDLRGSGRSTCGATLTFDQLADDVAGLLDHLGVEQAAVGGVSSGSGVALRVALRHPRRVHALVLVKPMYAGDARGYTEAQRSIFSMMDGVASRALDEGVQVLRPLYENLPAAMREKALAMIEAFDPASGVATSRFLASGAQPFGSPSDLLAVDVPTLLVRGEDAMHPAEVSELYATTFRHCTANPASTVDVAQVIGEFVDRCMQAVG